MRERLSDEVRARIELNPLRAFDSEHPARAAAMAERAAAARHLSPEDAAHFAQVRELLDVAGVAYELDPTLVRGLDYYTRTVFEFTSDALGAQSGVGGGGRYDGLVEQLGGPPTPGHGLGGGDRADHARRRRAAGDPRRSCSCSSRSTINRMAGAAVGRGWTGRAPCRGPDGSRDALRRAAFELLGEARAAGLRRRWSSPGRSLKGQLGHADALGARYVAILSPAARRCSRTCRAGPGGAPRQRRGARGAARPARTVS